VKSYFNLQKSTLQHWFQHICLYFTTSTYIFLSHLYLRWLLSREKHFIIQWHSPFGIFLGWMRGMRGAVSGLGIEETNHRNQKEWYFERVYRILSWVLTQPRFHSIIYCSDFVGTSSFFMNISMTITRTRLFFCNVTSYCTVLKVWLKGTGSRDRIQIFWQKSIILCLNKNLY